MVYHNEWVSTTEKIGGCLIVKAARKPIAESACYITIHKKSLYADGDGNAIKIEFLVGKA